MPLTKKGTERKCPCGEYFFPRNSLQTAHCIKGAMMQAEKVAKKREKVQRQEVRKRLERLKTRSELIREVQAIFNSCIRERDKEKPCISCGATNRKSWDAGHYRSTGAAPQLRFNPANCHKQCVHCNQHLSGNSIEYRKGLVRLIGLEAVERLENDQSVRKWTKDELKELKAMFRAWLRDLKARNTA